MDEFIKMLCDDYEMIDYRIKPTQIIFHIHSTRNKISCPYCGAETSKIHSIYQREIQDLPLHEKQSILLVDTRKFFCTNTECEYKTFSEVHPFVDRNARKTQRLMKSILKVSVQQSSVSASKTLQMGAIKISKSSICDMLKKNTSDNR